MDKIKEFTKNHFVEVIGFLGIIFLIIVITYLKMFQKTFTCELKTKEDNSKIYQRYILKQSNNKIKSINYYYTVTTPDAGTKRKVSEFYRQLLQGNEEKIFRNEMKLKFDGEKLIFSYDIDLDEVKGNSAYKSASSFVKSAKASGFTCK
jgi:hypothetical protein